MKIVIIENVSYAQDYDDIKNIFRIDLRNKEKLDVFIFTTGIYLNGKDNYDDYMAYKRYMESNFYDYLEDEFIKILHQYGISMIKDIYKCIMQKYHYCGNGMIDSYEIMLQSDIPIHSINLYPYKTPEDYSIRDSCELIPIIRAVLETIISLNQEKIL